MAYDTDAATIYSANTCIVMSATFAQAPVLNRICLSGYSILNTQYNDEYRYILDKKFSVA